jgi:hypothetical protein
MIPNNDASIGQLVVAIKDVQRGLNGQLGSTITPEASYDGATVREWLEALRRDIDRFLK